MLEAYSPLGNPGRPSVGASDPVVMEDSVIKDIAQKHKATPAQVLYATAMLIIILNYHRYVWHSSFIVV